MPKPFAQDLLQKNDQSYWHLYEKPGETSQIGHPSVAGMRTLECATEFQYRIKKMRGKLLKRPWIIVKPISKTHIGRKFLNAATRKALRGHESKLYGMLVQKPHQINFMMDINCITLKVTVLLRLCLIFAVAVDLSHTRPLSPRHSKYVLKGYKNHLSPVDRRMTRAGTS